MKKHVAFLRGINLGPHKKIKMAELRQHMEKAGFRDVTTYIQSGNIVLRSGKKPNALSKDIESLIRQYYGFIAETLVKTADEMQKIIDGNPYHDRDLSRLYVTMLYAKPDPERVKAIDAAFYIPEEFQLQGTTLYFYSPHGYGRAKMNNNFFEQKLKVTATTRNWRTMNMLLEMLKT